MATKPKRTKLKVSKEAIILALSQEPLKAGDWIHYREDADLSKCSVCAVGAVLRRTIGTVDYETAHKVTRNYVTPDDGRPLDLIRRRNYMGALSVFFEMQQRQDSDQWLGRVVTQEDRQNLIRFVVKNFPATITLSV